MDYPVEYPPLPLPRCFFSFLSFLEDCETNFFFLLSCTKPHFFFVGYLKPIFLGNPRERGTTNTVGKGGVRLPETCWIVKREEWGTTLPFLPPPLQQRGREGGWKLSEARRQATTVFQTQAVPRPTLTQSRCSHVGVPMSPHLLCTQGSLSCSRQKDLFFFSSEL